MAKLWAVKDGPRPHNQSGNPLDVTSLELTKVFGTASFRWMGTDPPSITPSQKPSDWPRFTVVQIEATEAKSALFPQGAGYYLIEGMEPSRAADLVMRLRRAGLESASESGK